MEHTLLLQKYLSYEIRGNCYKLLNLYPINWKQYVFVNRFESEQLIMPNYLCAVYCDIVNLLKTLLFYPPIRMSILWGDPGFWMIIIGAPILFNYFCNNKLTLKQDQKYAMEFHLYDANCFKSHLIKMHGNVIRQVTSFKLLCIYLDMSLSCKEHINFVCNQYSKSCFALQRLRQITSRTTSSSILNLVWDMKYFSYASNSFHTPKTSHTYNVKFKMYTRIIM